jgi:hypothetical protein
LILGFDNNKNDFDGREPSDIGCDNTAGAGGCDGGCEGGCDGCDTG